MSLIIYVNGIPQAQSRPRVFFRNGRVIGHSPKSSWFHLVHAEACKFANGNPLDVPLHVDTLFRFPRLKSGNKNVRYKSTKPDCDNLMKAILDALTQAGIWTDDGLVVSWSGKKMFVSDEETPGATITIEEVGNVCK